MVGRPGARDAPRGLTAKRIDVGGSSVVIFSFPIEVPDLGALSAAERDVVGRALGGASNVEIAQARGSAVRTVANLLARAYRKLGVSSRRELAAKIGMEGIDATRRRRADRSDL